MREFSLCLPSAVSVEARALLRLQRNRCACSVAHLNLVGELRKIGAFIEDAHPEKLSNTQKKEVIRCCARADMFSREYIQLHLQQMPDRGCEGTVVSYYVTMLSYIDHIREFFAYGETVCHHRPATLDDPPPPNTKALV